MTATNTNKIPVASALGLNQHVMCYRHASGELFDEHLARVLTTVADRSMITGLIDERRGMSCSTKDGSPGR